MLDKRIPFIHVPRWGLEDPVSPRVPEIREPLPQPRPGVQDGARRRVQVPDAGLVVFYAPGAHVLVVARPPVAQAVGAGVALKVPGLFVIAEHQPDLHVALPALVYHVLLPDLGHGLPRRVGLPHALDAPVQAVQTSF